MVARAVSIARNLLFTVGALEGLSCGSESGRKGVVHGTTNSLSFTDVIVSDKALETYIKDKIILVGRASAIFLKGVNDNIVRYEAAYPDKEIPSLEIHSSMLSNLIDKDYISLMPALCRFIAFAVVLLFSLFLLKLKNFWLISGSLLSLHFVVLAGAYYSFSMSLLWGPGISFIVIIPILSLLVFWLKSLLVDTKQYGQDREQSLIDK